MKTAALILCPHAPDIVPVAFVYFSHIEPQQWSLWPSVPAPDATGSAIHRFTEQGWVWDVRCFHADHNGTVGGLTAQLSTATLHDLAEGDNLRTRPEPAVWSLPLLVLELGRRSS